VPVKEKKRNLNYLNISNQNKLPQYVGVYLIEANIHHNILDNKYAPCTHQEHQKGLNEKQKITRTLFAIEFSQNPLSKVFKTSGNSA